MEWQYEAADASLALDCRQRFVDFLRPFCTVESDCLSAEIVFAELLANVVRHAPGSIAITVESDGQGLIGLDVCDTGPPFADAAALPEALYSESGRGLFVVWSLCPHFSVTRTALGNRVHVILPVVAKSSPFHVVPEQIGPSNDDFERDEQRQA